MPFIGVIVSPFDSRTSSASSAITMFYVENTSGAAGAHRATRTRTRTAPHAHAHTHAQTQTHMHMSTHAHARAPHTRT